MWTRQLLKQNGKIAFLRNYWTCVLACVLTTVMVSFSTGVAFSNHTSMSDETESVEELYRLWMQVPTEILIQLAIGALIGMVVVLLLSIFVGNVVLVGQNRYFMENREHRTNISCLFYGFQRERYKKTVLVMFLKELYVVLGTFLFVIPGIILSYRYMMVPYIAAENIHMDRRRIFALSRAMMKGHKMEAFELSLSFIGWYFLGVLSSGIVSVLYVNPYMQATFAEFYTAVKADAVQRGVLMPGELPGVLPAVDIPEL